MTRMEDIHVTQEIMNGTIVHKNLQCERTESDKYQNIKTYDTRTLKIVQINI